MLKQSLAKTPESSCLFQINWDTPLETGLKTVSFKCTTAEEGRYLKEERSWCSGNWRNELNSGLGKGFYSIFGIFLFLQIPALIIECLV